MMEKLLTSTNGNFSLYKKQGVGRNDTCYENLEVISDGLADKHVVEVRLESDIYQYVGKPVKYQYSDVYIAHGMRMDRDSIEDIREYISVLEEAIDFTLVIRKFLDDNPEWKMSK